MGSGGDGNKAKLKAAHAAAAFHKPHAAASKASMAAAAQEVGDLPSIARSFSLDSLARLSAVKDDLTVLKSIWFKRLSGGDHAQRLESFYGPQAHAYDRFRASFLWGRKPMLASAAARIRDMSDIVWVDLGGGTGENVKMMNEFLPLENFKKVYVVDLCHSLCKEAQKKVDAHGWKNVQVIEGDACQFVPDEGKATLVTFSYSLSMIPPFHSAIDAACSYLDPNGFMAVTDFFVSSKHDLPLRQMGWMKRFFWRATFDLDGIDLGPERREYLEHKMTRVYEYNSEGGIPYVPLLRAPYYIWIGQKDTMFIHHNEARVEAPPLFPPTFLYSQSWEDPAPDMEVLHINSKDTVLTLTSGGCNTLNLVLQGAREVVGVDCNPAQSALLEMKKLAVMRLSYADTWELFGEGKHSDIKRLYEQEFAPFLTQTSQNFWKDRLYYFTQGLYYQGGMGNVCWVVQWAFWIFGFSGTVKRFCDAPSLEEQKKMWNSLWVVRFFKHAPAFLYEVMNMFVQIFMLNRLVLWYGGGVPAKQYELILNDNRRITEYVGTTLNGAAENSHMATSNYFYYNCLMGRFTPHNCPSYLKRDNFEKLKTGLIENLTIMTCTFMEALCARKYSKVILMDHVDWLDTQQATELAECLQRQVVPGGKMIWRTASLRPPYVDIFAKHGFEVKCISRIDQGYMDRVNMYSSFWVGTRKGSKNE
mmetsp:Transcript_21887/g.60757  ORF Transcript_21887/g.60757 Transcript_21887/m.60757 type:complete len:700 (-) Transcript_21887:282-2381(-)|eukprot:CAMPEP_0117659736 /NCGR_PEP_ID=MMETSP0804-20121206/6591_1 /TAXON_ID=1074897 /ORGANISM="Tetraselmis astigmatica, Strain CCMP880" /LENGTH=699 /DNA_ID=CAMNT_0005466413 /DNA_START=88 /DNA_END=2187 /DNA_ORIENTATION=+